MIYYAEINEYWIKIGMTVNWERRSRQLERSYKCEPRLLGVHSGSRWTEQSMHYMFDHLRYERTECFRPGVDLLDHIKRETIPWTKAYDDDPDSHDELAVVHFGAYLQWLNKLSEHNGASVSRTFGEAMSVFAKSIGYAEKIPGFTDDRLPHDLHGYEPPTFDTSQEDFDDDDEAVADEEESAAMIAVSPVTPRQFVMEGGWG